MGACWVCVGESNVNIIESMGKFSKIATPGCTCLNCCTEVSVGELSFKVQQHTLSVETRSKDNVFVTIKLAIQLKVAQKASEFPKSPETSKQPPKKKKHTSDSEQELEPTQRPDEDNEDATLLVDMDPDTIVYNAFYHLDQPIKQVLALVEEYFRFHGMNYTMDEMFAAKNEMTHELLRLLNRKMNKHGYIIVNVLVMDIDPDKNVKKAMNDIIASEKEKRAQQSRAEAEKMTKILAAEADARTRELAGEGIANARKAIVAGLQESVENFRNALPNSDPSQILTTVLMTQYLDTIKEAAGNARNTFIMPSSPAQVTSMEDQFRTAILSSNKNLD
eukprot:TRINITY_DN85_c0_g1_i4.p1 TRINITY_DN85_c0_g1~~TRINITY_DN85_c0_g1_i4.p1  ORF type:complete len:334 (-),score=81.83 TRINITY_DN85_c0_g1_i4:24-1025(-)